MRAILPGRPPESPARGGAAEKGKTVPAHSAGRAGGLGDGEEGAEGGGGGPAAGGPSAQAGRPNLGRKLRENVSFDQLRDLELQRRLSTDSKGSSSPHPSKSPKTATPPRAREAGTSPSAGGNFCRANSWSVKQPSGFWHSPLEDLGNSNTVGMPLAGTLPSHSLLPVPVRQKLHQRTRTENGCPQPANHQQMSTHTQSATGQGLAARRTGAPAPVPLPIKSTVDNNNKSVADERKNNTANSRQMMNRPTPPPGLVKTFSPFKGKFGPRRWTTKLVNSIPWATKLATRID
jgi:hypothetical protein